MSLPYLERRRYTSNIAESPAEHFHDDFHSIFIPEPLFNLLLASLIWSCRICTQSLGPGSLSTWFAVQYFSVKTERKHEIVLHILTTTNRCRTKQEGGPWRKHVHVFCCSFSGAGKSNLGTRTCLACAQPQASSQSWSELLRMTAPWAHLLQRHCALWVKVASSWAVTTNDGLCFNMKLAGNTELVVGKLLSACACLCLTGRIENAS